MQLKWLIDQHPLHAIFVQKHIVSFVMTLHKPKCTMTFCLINEWCLSHWRKNDMENIFDRLKKRFDKYLVFESPKFDCMLLSTLYSLTINLTIIIQYSPKVGFCLLQKTVYMGISQPLFYQVCDIGPWY